MRGISRLSNLQIANPCSSSKYPASSCYSRAFHLFQASQNVDKFQRIYQRSARVNPHSRTPTIRNGCGLKLQKKLWDQRQARFTTEASRHHYLINVIKFMASPSYGMVQLGDDISPEQKTGYYWYSSVYHVKNAKRQPFTTGKEETLEMRWTHLSKTLWAISFFIAMYKLQKFNLIISVYLI